MHRPQMAAAPANLTVVGSRAGACTLAYRPLHQLCLINEWGWASFLLGRSVVDSVEPFSAQVARRVARGESRGKDVRALSFVCPVSKERVETGIYADTDTLKQVLSGRMPVRCPSCQQVHYLSAADFEPDGEKRPK